VQKLPQGIALISTPTATTPIGKPGGSFSAMLPPTSSAQATIQPKKSSKLLIIIIIIISSLILIGAGVLGLFWNSWFGG